MEPETWADFYQIIFRRTFIMAKPSKLPEWASNPTDPAPAVAITEPSSPVKAQGYIAEKPTFGVLNWLLNLIYQWIDYINDTLGLAVLIKTDSYPLTTDDMNQIFEMNKSAATNLTLPAASGVPSGSWIRIKNINTGLVTIVGTVGGIVNPTLTNMDETFIWSDGTNWYSKVSKSILTAIFTPLMESYTVGSYIVLSGHQAAVAATANEVNVCMPCAGVLKNMTVHLATNTHLDPTVINSKKNGYTSNLTCTIPPESTAVVSDNSHYINFIKGDFLASALENIDTARGDVQYLSITYELILFC
jgi:hypothetical protein